MKDFIKEWSVLEKIEFPYQVKYNEKIKKQAELLVKIRNISMKLRLQIPGILQGKESKKILFLEP